MYTRLARSVSLILYLILRFCSPHGCSPFTFPSFSTRSFRGFFSSGFLFSLPLLPRRVLVPHSLSPPRHLVPICSSIYSSFVFSSFSPFVFHPPYVCFSFVVIYFTLTPPFLPHFVLHSFFHLFAIYFPFIPRSPLPFIFSPPSLRRRAKYRARSRLIHRFVARARARDRFSARNFPRSLERMDVKANRKVFWEGLRTSDSVSEIREPQLSK